MRQVRALELLFGWRLRDAAKECPTPKVEAGLEPSEPGAWAAWARERERELPAAAPNQRPGPTREPRPGPLSASRLEMYAAVYPRGYGLRMRM
jgi:hypothetical protein